MKFFAKHVLSFAHMVQLSILDTRDNCACPCVRIGNSEKIHNDFLWGPQKIKINKKIMDLTKKTVWVLFNTPCFWVLNANASSALNSIETENLMIQTQD